MKHIKIFILMFLLVNFLCSGCGDGTYVAEKMFWKANNKLQKLVEKEKHNENIEKEEMDALIFSFKEITLRYPYWKSAPLAYFNLAMIYEMKNDSEGARKQYELICKTFPHQDAICVAALKNIAVLYERADNWDEAEKTYKKISTAYPYTEIGLMVPFYLAQQYKKRGESEKSGLAFRSALKTYKDAIENSQSEMVKIVSLNYAVSCMLYLEGEEEAIAFLKSLSDREVGPIIQACAVFNIAKIYHYHLKNKEEAVKYYQQIVEKYPEGDLAKKAIEEIKELSKE
ncbi:MAG: tetratricopeptide repeat protein [Candidatus Omnitrophica bacterium]|nr:tetratricopeptide repeat protein [Candidatus Omnitrophota bacterium]MBU4478274.1 tetratricopeptide repeat protein [Candidatus Omnitrophota bacterium]MCG2703342.1 tetratricopeptide repeat protein [Candidatus Omnitrophota bacterium]